MLVRNRWLMMGVLTVGVLGTTSCRRSRSPAERAELEREAAAAVARDRPDLAREAYETALGSDPGDPALWKALGDLALDGGDLPGAAQAYRRSLELDPAGVAARFNLALVLLRRFEYPAAETEFRKVLEARPSNPDCLYNLAMIRLEQDDPAGARSQLESLLALHPDHAPSHRQLGAILQAMGDPARAVDHLDRAHALEPLDPTWLETLARMKEVLGRPGEALAHYQASLARDPGRLASMMGSGILLVELGRIEAGLGVLEETVRIHPEAAGARAYLGRALRRQGKAAEALEHLEAARRLGLEKTRSDDLFSVSGEIGLTLVAMGKEAEALAHLRVARSAGQDLASALERERRWLPDPVYRAIETALGRLDGAPPEGPPGPTPRSTFREVAAPSGLAFSHCTGLPILRMPQVLGPGVAFVDFDVDGFPDVYVTDSPPGDSTAGGRLYRNAGDGSFRDVTREADASVAGTALGVAAADLDGSGDPDLVITGLRLLVLLMNRGDGTFRRVPVAIPENHQGFLAGSAPFDLDGDGLLDLYVSAYVRLGDDPTAPAPAIVDYPGGRQLLATTIPGTYPPERDLLLQNRGGGRFEEADPRLMEVTSEGRALGVLAGDFLGPDGRTDLLVANDTTANRALVNRDGRLSDEARQLMLEDQRGSMGIALGEVSPQGRSAIFITNWYRESNALYVERDSGHFADLATPAGIAEIGFRLVGWGAAFADFDGDGFQDLIHANGDTTTGRYDPATYLSSEEVLAAQPMVVLRGSATGTFEDVTRSWGLDREVLNGRGLAVGDVDLDGRPDVLVGVNAGRLRLYRNELAGDHHWILIELVGSRAARDGSGAILEVEAGDQRWRRIVTRGGSHLSSHWPVEHVGLGTTALLGRVRVRWPSGQRQELTGLPVDCRLRIHEP